MLLLAVMMSFSFSVLTTYVAAHSGLALDSHGHAKMLRSELPQPLAISLHEEYATSELPPPVTISAHEEYATFVHQMMSALTERPIQNVDALGHVLEIIATPEFAKKGEWVEFGVFQGGCIRKMSDARKRLGSTKPIHGFDSFLGLPSKWRDSDLGKGFNSSYLNKGSFNMQGKPPFDEPKNFKWHVGWFNETVASFVKDPSTENITFAHMDADMYVSSAQALEGVEHRLAPGVFLVFDELIGYPEYEENEMKALYELAKRSGRDVKVIGHKAGMVEEDPGTLKQLIKDKGGEFLPQDALVQLV